MAPISQSLNLLCNSLRSINRECEAIKEQTSNNLLPHPGSSVGIDPPQRKLMEYPHFVAELVALQCRHPGLASALEELKRTQVDSPTLIVSPSLESALSPVLTGLENIEVAYYVWDSSTKKGETTIIEENDPELMLSFYPIYKVPVVIKTYNPCDEPTLRMKVKCSSTNPDRSLSLHLNLIIRAPLYAWKHKFRGKRVHTRRISLI